ncbi:MAG: glycyl-radical enzyme activating protein [Bacteroidales bacterium]|jgi:pyruvate formate lyase activating enzyme|nr:glycyl-radical enzyme activating protein [Bacteroidales bacterium]MDD2204657.1 glycyl-radical enzyme activating protein [Bacteroidales bacterium]MDD3913668.1 glycyl-radical enzyme activating protein [Bacteroidales bacterium]MDD4633919.1 glycyl-radical enzyme activating protein [Bacteroidales bacterium]
MSGNQQNIKAPYIFDIKRYSINDGPGIRTTVFFKGCKLDCIWCHNPEGKSTLQEKMYTVNKCIRCLRCVSICPEKALVTSETGIVLDNNLCKMCGRCVAACPTKAMEFVGNKFSIDYLVEEIKKDIPFYDKSGGGMTVSGGDPILYVDFLKELLIRCGEEKIHRAIDTTILASPQTIKELSEHCELFLIDLKMMDADKHKKHTGVSNVAILSNIKLLADSGIDFIIRIPLIKGVNADSENLTESAKFLSSLPWRLKKVNLLPYHDIGKGKHQRLQTTYNAEKIVMMSPSAEEIEQAIGIFGSYGITAVQGG